MWSRDRSKDVGEMNAVRDGQDPVCRCDRLKSSPQAHSPSRDHEDHVTLQI
jgi:hypothetical protein